MLGCRMILINYALVSEMKAMAITKSKTKSAVFPEKQPAESLDTK
jgi:hypothetical protein